MALTASGEIKMSDINTELGNTSTDEITLGESDVRGLFDVASGQIRLATDGYGKSNLYTYTISANASQLNMRAAAVTDGWNQSSALAVIINSGVTIYSGSTGSYAMVIDGAYAGGVTLTNNGTILGRGGAGASVSSGGCIGCGCTTYTGNSPNGGSGGPALQITTATTIVNGSGRISGGGGGGGAGGQFQVFGVHGGAGGGGVGNGSGGSNTGSAGAGGAGNLTGAGGGGAGNSGLCTIGGNGLQGGNGGAGGSWAATGSTGTYSHKGTGVSYDTHNPKTAGGSGGAATSGASYVTWTSTGTRNGSVG